MRKEFVYAAANEREGNNDPWEAGLIVFAKTGSTHACMHARMHKAVALDWFLGA